jgi:hypothetical protein
MRPRFPIELPKNRRLRVCFYARFSTDDPPKPHSD